MIKNNKAITLLALVITIVVLVILGGSVFSMILGDNGIINKTIEANKRHKIAEITENLEIKEAEIYAENGGSLKVNDYIDYIKQENVVQASDVSLEDENTAYVIIDGFVFVIRQETENEISIQYEGNEKTVNTKPQVEVLSKNVTTNSATISFRLKETGSYKLYIKLDDGEYSSPEKDEKLNTLEAIDKEVTINNLTQGKTYIIKIEAKSKIGKEKTVKEENVVIETVTALTKSNTTFEYDKTDWTNGSVTVTASTTETGYTLQTSKDGENWSTQTSQTYTSNGVIHARLVDSNGQEGGSTTANIDKIDTNPPTISDVTSDTSVSLYVTGIDNAKTGESASGINGYFYSTENTKPTLETEEWKSITASTSTVNKTITGLTKDTTYYIWFKDQAGNISNTATKKTRLPADPVYGSSIQSTYSHLYTTTGEPGTDVSSYSGNYDKSNTLHGRASTYGGMVDIDAGSYGYGYSDYNKNNHNTTSLINSGTNTQGLTQEVSNRWVEAIITGTNMTYAATISDFKLKFKDGNSYSLQNSVTNGYIEPLVVVGSASKYGGKVYKFTNSSNLITGGSASGDYAIIRFYFKVKNKSPLTAVVFTSNKSFHYWADGFNAILLGDGFEISTQAI